MNSAQASWFTRPRFELGTRGALIARLDFTWRDEIWFRQWQKPVDRQSAFTRTDLSLRWERGEAGAWAELYLNNLEDRRKIRTSLNGENVHRQWFLAPPRMVGFRVGWSWRGEESPFAAR
jgi:outer membrane receptor protein involved in Fe transport